MANELARRWLGTAPKTAFEIITRQSDDKVWNTSTLAWETYSAGNITQYAIDLADESIPNLVTADFPSAIIPDVWVRLSGFESQSGTPAVSDLEYPLGDVRFVQWTGAALEVAPRTVSSFPNRPWLTEDEFTDRIRLTVGTSPGEVATGTFCSNRRSAEARVYSYLPDGTKKYKTMTHRVPGERFPQEGPVLVDGSYSYSVAVPNMVSTPSYKVPQVWRNLSGHWRDRWDVRSTKLLTVTTDYTLDYNANSVTIVAADENDVFHIEYWHTLETVPEMIRDLVAWITAEKCLIARFGIDSGRYEEWADQHKAQYETDLNLLKKQELSIPEFDQPKLYEDWKDVGATAFDFPVRRA